MPKSECVAINEAIKGRVFEAIRTLIELKLLRGRQTYCNKYGIDKRNFYAQEADITILRMQLFWIAPLVSDFGINAKWLFTGEGHMFWEDELRVLLRKKRESRYPDKPQ